MNTGHCGQVHHQTFGCLAEPACKQADLLYAAPDRLGAEVKPFSAHA